MVITSVSILILLEMSLEVQIDRHDVQGYAGFNPYFVGDESGSVRVFNVASFN